MKSPDLTVQSKTTIFGDWDCMVESRWFEVDHTDQTTAVQGSVHNIFCDLLLSNSHLYLRNWTQIHSLTLQVLVSLRVSILSIAKRLPT